MPQPQPARMRRCPDCDGFPVVAIDLGNRLPDGTRATLHISCPACEGTGHIPTLRRLITQAADAVFTARAPR